MNMRDDYFAKVGERPNLLVESLCSMSRMVRGVAVDLGAGNLRDCKFLLRQGFQRVIAVDNSEETKRFMMSGIEFHPDTIQSFNFLATGPFDAVIACNSLFYLQPQEVRDVFEKVRSTLRSPGFFACNVLGDEDELGKEPQSGRRSFFTREEVYALIKPFNFKICCEIKKVGPTVTGRKVFNHQWGIIVGM